MRQDTDPRQLRSFGVIVGGIFAVLGFWPALFRGTDIRLWSLVLAILLIVPALIYPRSLRLIYRVWMTFGDLLGWCNTRVILGVIFYGLFTPLGLVMRLRGRDALRRHIDSSTDTYRVVRLPRPSSHLTRQF